MAVSGTLIFSPSFSGHRPIYCQAIADVLHDAGQRIVIAGAFADLPEPRRQAFVVRLRRRGPVTLLDTSRMSRGGRDIATAELSRLIRETGVETTVLTEADDHLAALSRQIGPRRRLPGRRVGVFLRTTRYVHAGRAVESWRRRLGRWRHGRSRWDSDPYLFHESLLPRFGLLDAALCLDEAFVSTRSGPYEWLPDIFAPFDPGDWVPNEHERELVSRLRDFEQRSGDRPILVYFGRPQARRGYPDVLRLAEAVNGCFVHCGERAAVDGEEALVERLRAELSRRGTLFETDAYVAGYETVRRFIQAGACAVLPYRRHYGSSGVMLQAIDAGRPVLVFEGGLMSWRTTQFGLGRTAPEGSFDCLVAAFNALQHDGVPAYQSRLTAFMRLFARERVEGALRHALGIGGAAVTPPRSMGEGAAG